MQQARSVLFGRDRELAEIDLALARSAAGTSQVLLVGGDAGIGKTSLVTELAGRGQALGFTVLTGHCLDIGTRRPFGAVHDALQTYLSERDDEALPPVTRRLAPLLRAQAGPGVVAGPGLLEDLRLVLTELAGQGPVLLTLEDMHWAGRSTQEFAVAVAAAARGPLLLALTFRADDLHRRHPFRRALREIGRTSASVRIDLGPLDRDAVTALVRTRTGGEDPELAGSVLTRSEGNPLFVEELLAAGGDGVPEHLNDLLLARIDALSLPTRGLLRLASVDGSRIDPDVLRNAARLDLAEFETCLREGLDANVLTSSNGHLDFRHGLLREAVYADLLPGERTRAHAEVATAVQARVDVAYATDTASLGRLAFHWHAAQDLPKAFAASVRAGLAEQVYGAPEAIAHLELALDLWNRVPQPAELGGIDKAELLRTLGEIAWGHGEWELALRSLRAALSEVDAGADRLVASRVYSSYGAIPVEFDDLSHQEALRRAVDYAEGSSSEALAKALSSTGWWHWHHFAVDQAADCFGRAVDVATAAGSPSDQVEAGIGLGDSLMMLGRCAEGIAQLRRTMAVAEGAGLLGHALGAQAELAHFLIATGQVEAGMRVAETGRRRAVAAGLPVVATFNGTEMVVALRWNGQLDRADELLEELRPMGMFEFEWLSERSAQLMARGELDAAVQIERRMQWWLNESDSLWQPVTIAREVDLFSSLGQVEEAVNTADRLLSLLARSRSPLQLSVAARAAYSALAAAGSAGVPPPEGMPQRASDALQRALEHWSNQWSHTVHAAAALHAVAIARSLAGETAVPEWRAAEAAAAPFGAYHVLGPRLGLARALLNAHQRDEGRVLVLDIWNSARTLGARWFQDQAAHLARSNRIPIPEKQPPSRIAALTPRELEVLEVLATGATNRAIAQRLFISEKTVSVHVTNLLAKMGAANRGEAAAWARKHTAP